MHSDASVSNGMLVDSLAVLNLETDIFDSIAVINKMIVHLFTAVLVVNRAENECGSLMVSDHVTDDISFTVF